ncbi:MAG: ribonuclease H-like YkuK family protein [Candidatus Sungbacteria bacterium]|nr:ribonuclease H-like YkuK family protein [Candidatus Sungbacteria bacterium]
MSIERKKEIYFLRENNSRLAPDGVADQIRAFVAEQPERFYKIIIGTDSHPASPVSLVTAVTVWRVGNGAIHFWTKSDSREFHSLRERIWQEAIASITLAQEMRTLLQQKLGDEFFWDGNEIHVDIGKNGPTRELIDSVVGMIKGYNFLPVIKPHAFGASVVADRHT